jgi:hypothetical protein
METTFTKGQPRADLNKREFDNLVYQKGRDVVLETALECPCKSPSTNQQSNCKNCGGTGWIFINPRSTKMILTAIDAVTEFRPWSEELRGTVSITALEQDEMSAMDRITVTKGESIHNEVVFIKQKGSVYFCYTTYNIKKISYIGLYISQDQPLKRLVLNEDYLVADNILRFSEEFILANIPDFISGESTSLTIRYKHAPQFHVIEMKRETMQSDIYQKGVSVNQNMPVSAIARRSHYQLSAQNLTGDRFINNSYQLTCNQREESVVIQTFSSNYDFYLTQGDTFHYDLSIIEGGVSVDITSRIYSMQVRNDQDDLIFEFIQNQDLNIIAPNIVSLDKLPIQTQIIPEGIYNYDLKEQISPTEIGRVLSGKFIIIEQQTV